MTEKYPLAWPAGWPRTAPDRQQYSLQGGHQRWDLIIHRVLTELRLFKARDIIISTNQPIRQSDGMPYKARRLIEDPGAAVYFTIGERQLVVAQDNYQRLEDNLRSIAIALDHFRGVERHGGGHMMDRAFTGFEALPAPGVIQWRNVLGSKIRTLADAEGRFRELARERHPDRQGGSDAAMADLNVAIGQARVELT